MNKCDENGNYALGRNNSETPKYKSMAEKKAVFDKTANKNGLVRMHMHIKDELKYIEQVENLPNDFNPENEVTVPETEAVISFLIDEYYKNKRK